MGSNHPSPKTRDLQSPPLPLRNTRPIWNPVSDLNRCGSFDHCGFCRPVPSHSANRIQYLLRLSQSLIASFTPLSKGPDHIIAPDSSLRLSTVLAFRRSRPAAKSYPFLRSVSSRSSRLFSDHFLSPNMSFSPNSPPVPMITIGSVVWCVCQFRHGAVIHHRRRDSNPHELSLT